MVTINTEAKLKSFAVNINSSLSAICQSSEDDTQAGKHMLT